MPEVIDQGGAVFNIKAYKTSTNTWADAIDQAIAAAKNNPPGRGTVLIPSGTYVIPRSIKIPSDTTIAGVGMYASVLKFVGRTYPYENARDAMFDLSGASDAAETQRVHIYDLGFEGENTTRVVAPQGPGVPRFIFSNIHARHITVERCRFEYGVGPGMGIFGAKHVVVRDCIASNNGDTGFNVNCYHGQLIGNRGENNGWAFIEASCAYTQICNNYARGNLHVGIGVGGFTQAGADANGFFNVVTGNICVQNLTGIAIVSGTSYSVVANNICHGNAQVGIQVLANGPSGVRTDNNLIHDNVCTSNGKSGSGNFYGIMVQAPENRVGGNKVANVDAIVVDVDTREAAGYKQAYGILTYGGHANELLYNDSRSHVLADYSFEGASPTNTVLKQLRPGTKNYVQAGSTFANTAREVLQNQSALDFGSVPAQGVMERTVPVPGAIVGSSATASPRATLPGSVTWSAAVLSNDSVTIRVVNAGTAAAAVGSAIWAVDVALAPA